MMKSLFFLASLLFSIQIFADQLSCEVFKFNHDKKTGVSCGSGELSTDANGTFSNTYEPCQANLIITPLYERGVITLSLRHLKPIKSKPSSQWIPDRAATLTVPPGSFPYTFALLVTENENISYQAKCRLK